MIKRILAPVYEAYRHHVDIRESAGLFDMDNLLGLLPVGSDRSGSCKIRISHYSESTWNSLKTVVEEFVNDENCDVLVVLARDDERMRRQAISVGAPYILFDDYDIENDQPDVLVISHIMDDMFAGIRRDCVGKVFVVSAALIHYFEDIEAYIEKSREKYGNLEPDYYIYDRAMYRELESTGEYGDKLVCIGNPKYDGIYNAMNRSESDIRWRKLKGKKKVLWATDHGVQYGKIAEDFCFEKYAEDIFAYFAENPELGLIFRPHATFLEEMLKHGYWTEKDIDELKNRIQKTDNIVWDENDSYDKAYAVCDGIITDCHCGIIHSALPTLKPIALLYRDSDTKPMSEAIESCQYSVYDKDQLIAFLDNIGKGIDEKRTVREHVRDVILCNFDGMNGKRIYEFILNHCE